MRFVLFAAVAVSLISGAVLAGQEDEIQSDLVVVTATPRPADVKMVSQTAKPVPTRDEPKPWQAEKVRTKL